MAMLAGPKKKNKYLLQPRGKPLYHDSNRFGTKMLEKMGWSEGKGLGVKLNGQQEFIRVSYKDDQKGMGYEDRDDQWTQHEAQFNDLLQTLSTGASGKSSSSASEDESACNFVGFQTNGGEKPSKKKTKKIKVELSGESLEEKSKQSKARVHYKKFTRGKDLSRYSSKDLANIFGKKALEDETPDVPNEIENNVTEEPKTEKNENESVQTTDPENSYGVQIRVSTTSVHDYFKAKMEAMKNRLKNSSTVPDIIGSKEEQAEVEVETRSNEKKNKKKKKDKHRDEEQKNVANEVPINSDNNIDHSELKPKKKKKKEKDVELNEMASESLFTSPDIDMLEQNNELIKKKKKKKKMDVVEVVEESKSKKIMIEEIVDTSHNTTVANSLVNDSSKRKKKDKRKRDAELEDESIQPTKKKKLKEEVVNAIQDSTDKKSKKNKKKSTQVINEMGDKVDASENKVTETERRLVSNNNEDGLSKVEPQKSDAENLQEPNEDLTNENSVPLQRIPDTNKIIINGYTAELYRYVDLHAFSNSNLSSINGYGLTNEMEVTVKHGYYDKERIDRLWSTVVKHKDPKVIVAKKNELRNKGKRISIREQIQQKKKINVFMSI